MQFIVTKKIPYVFLLFTLLLPFGAAAQSSDAALKAEVTENIAADDLSGEDMVVRNAALKALGTAAGTVVVMNVQTGRIYSIVNQKWAIQEGFKPCSTIKLVTGVAGVTERLIKMDGDLSKGTYRLGLDDALAYSNNAFFQKVGSNLGSEKMVDYARMLGLGDVTGINAENEFAGKLPDGNENLRIYSHADDFEVTPLQLAVMVSAITNGGKVVIPQIPKNNYQKTNFRGYLRRNLDLAPTLYERMIPGMVGAVNYGTAKGIKDTENRVAGKTGSCIFDRTWIGLFASVAPIQNPRFAVVVITRGKYARGKYSAAIAGNIYDVLEPRFSEKFNNSLAKKDVAPRRDNSAENKIVVTSAKRTEKPEQIAPPEIKNTVITYKRDNNEKPAEVSKESQKPVVVINGQPEIVRPRVVNN